MRPKVRSLLLLGLSPLSLVSLWLSGARTQEETAGPVITERNEMCVRCHGQQSPGIVAQWRDSSHARAGVGCVECHQAEAGDADAFSHMGARIATIVSPRDCAQCHEKEAREFEASHHAKGAQFIGSLDNILGEIAEGRLAAVNGCWQCHGSTVRFRTDREGNIARTPLGTPVLDPETWPNTGIGRVNMDGSRGSCTACHSRHAFSKAVARQPEVCGKCHMGPDHPQIEIFEESKHGIAYRTRLAEMNLNADEWVLGRDYSAAPTCSTCHMSAAPTQPLTHDVGARISWTLRPVLSSKLENWQAKRDNMKEVCRNCHSGIFIDNFYTQYDDSVDMYNEKFARPAQEIMDRLREKARISATPFDDEIEWTFFRLWHHEGRRARMGVSMQGPDYTQWHGFFEVTETFYLRFIPQAQELAEGDAELEAFIEEILHRPEHRWKQGLTPEQIEEIQGFYRERYGQQ